MSDYQPYTGTIAPATQQLPQGMTSLATREVAMRYRLIEEQNPWMRNDPDAMTALALSDVDTPTLMSSVGQHYAMQSGSSLASRMQQMTEAEQRALYDHLSLPQQAALQQLGYKVPDKPSEGGLLHTVFSAAGTVLSPIASGLGAIPGVKQVGSGLLEGLTWLGNIPGHIYRTVRTQDDWGQVAGLLGAVAGVAGAIALAPFTGGGSLAALGTMASIGLMSGGALVGAAAGVAATTNPMDWGRAFTATWDGEKTFDRPSVRKVNEMLEDPRVNGLAQDLAEVDLDIVDLAREMAGQRDPSMNSQMRKVEKLAAKIAAPGTPQYEQAVNAMLNALQDGTFQQAVSTLVSGKISPGRDFADILPDAIARPGSTPYNLLSGITDAAFTVAVDPTLMATGVFHEMSAAKRTLVVGKGASAAELTNAFREVVEKSPGVMRAHVHLAEAVAAVEHGGLTKAMRISPNLRRIYTELVTHAQGLRDTGKIASLADFNVTHLHEYFLGSGKLEPMLRGIGTVSNHRGIELLTMSRRAELSGKVRAAARGITSGLSDVRTERKLLKYLDGADAADVAKVLPGNPHQWVSLDGMVGDASMFTTLNPKAYEIGQTMGRMPIVGRTIAKLGDVMTSMSTMALAGRTIELSGEKAIRDVKALSEMGRYFGLPSWARSAWADTILSADSAAVRAKAVNGYLASMLRMAGLDDTFDGRALIEEFVEKSKQLYGQGDELVVNGHSMNVGIFLNQQANYVVMPDLRELAVRANAVRLGRIIGVADLPVMNTVMNKIWKPLVLLRIGFIPRAAGEELAAFMSRGGLGSLTQEAGARYLGKMQAFHDALTKQKNLIPLTQDEQQILAKAAPIMNRIAETDSEIRLVGQAQEIMKAKVMSATEEKLIQTGYMGVIPAHVRPIVKMAQRIGFEEPVMHRLTGYADWLATKLGSGLGKQDAIDAKIAKWAGGDISAPRNEQAAKILGQLGAGNKPVKMVNQAPRVTPNIFRLNAGEFADSIMFGKAYSVRRMLFGGVHDDLVEAGTAWYTRHATVVMNELSARNHGTIDSPFDNTDVVTRLERGRDGKVREVRAHGIWGERTYVGQARGDLDGYANGVHDRAISIMLDPVTERAMLDHVQLIRPSERIVESDLEAAANHVHSFGHNAAGELPAGNAMTAKRANLVMTELVGRYDPDHWRAMLGELAQQGGDGRVIAEALKFYLPIDSPASIEDVVTALRRRWDDMGSEIATARAERAANVGQLVNQQRELAKLVSTLENQGRQVMRYVSRFDDPADRAFVSRFLRQELALGDGSVVRRRAAQHEAATAAHRRELDAWQLNADAAYEQAARAATAADERAYRDALDAHLVAGQQRADVRDPALARRMERAQSPSISYDDNGVEQYGRALGHTDWTAADDAALDRTLAQLEAVRGQLSASDQRVLDYLSNRASRERAFDPTPWDSVHPDRADFPGDVPDVIRNDDELALEALDRIARNAPVAAGPAPERGAFASPVVPPTLPAAPTAPDFNAPWLYNTWEDARQGILSSLRQSIYDPSLQADHVARALRSIHLDAQGQFLDTEFRAATVMLYEIPSLDGISIDDLARASRNPSLILNNRAVLERAAQKTNDQVALAANYELAAEVARAKASMVGVAPDAVTRPRMMRQDRVITDGRPHGQLSVDVDTKLDGKPQLWFYPDEAAQAHMRPMPDAAVDPVEEWTRVMFDEIRAAFGRGQRTQLNAKVKLGDVGEDGVQTVVPLVHRWGHDGTREGVAPDQPLRPGDTAGLYDTFGKPVIPYEPAFFDESPIPGSTPNGIMEELVGPMFEDLVARTGRRERLVQKRVDSQIANWGLPSQSTDLVPVTRSKIKDVMEVPAEDRATWAISRLFTEQKIGGFEKMVQFGFDRVIGPSIDAIVRTPMAFHAFAQRYIANKKALNWMLDPALTAKVDSIMMAANGWKKGIDVDPDGLAERIRVIAKYATGDAKAETWTTRQALGWLDGHTDGEIDTLLTNVLARGAHDAEDLAKQAYAYAKQLSRHDLTELRTSLVFSSTPREFLAMVERRLPAGALESVAKMQSPKVQEAIQQDPFLSWLNGTGFGARGLDEGPENAWNILVAMRTNVKHVEQVAGDSAAIAAISDVVPFLDSHEFKTQFADYGKGFMPFWYAEENFLKRWGRGLAQEGPAVIRRMQLTYMGLKSAGIVRTDSHGRDWFVYPGSGLLADAVSRAVPGIGSLAATGIMFQSPTDQLLPGLNSRFGTPSFNPLVSIPMGIVTSLMPEAQPMERALLGDFSASRAIIDQVIPAHLRNLYSAVLGDGNSGGRLASAQMAAIAYLEAHGQGLPDDANADQIDDFLRTVREHARVIVVAQALAGFATPGSPSAFAAGDTGVSAFGTLDEKDQLSDEYMTLVRMLGIEDGTARFLELHPTDAMTAFGAQGPEVPNALAYTVPRNVSSTGAPLPSTEGALAFYQDHQNYMEAFPNAGPWLLPQDYNQGDRSQYAYDQQTIAGLRNRRTPEEFLRAIKFKEASLEYFQKGDAYDAAIAAATEGGRQDEARRLKAEKDAQLLMYRAAHPVFAEELQSSDGRERRARVLKEMRTVVQDPGAPQTPQTEGLKTAMQAFDAYSTQLAVLGTQRTAIARQRINELKQAYTSYMDDLVMAYPGIMSFWVSILRPESSL